MRRECDRLKALLEDYEARAVATAVIDHHQGLRQRVLNFEAKLKVLEANSPSS